MIETPQIVQSAGGLAAVIRFTIPREEIRAVMGPAIQEVIETVKKQGVGISGPVFSHHFRMDPEVFDFEVGVLTQELVAPAGRVKPGRLPTGRVIRTVYRGGYEGLPQAWGDFQGWIERNDCPVEEGFWECYVTGPESSANPVDWRTELNRPVRES